jgi:CBS domain containing-hemolysin-like protein
MPQHYAPLPPHSLAKLPSFHRPMQVLPQNINISTPAIEVMTDLKKVMAFFIFFGRSIDAAKQRMANNNVHLLLAIDEQNHVLGLITATDIQSEKPVQFILQNGGKREDIQVKDIMTSHDKLEVLYMDDVASAKVGNIVATLMRSGRQHALVVDREGDMEKVRGIFSLNQLARQLGVQIHTHEVARTFAEIQSHLGVTL